MGQMEMKCISLFYVGQGYSGERCGPWASCLFTEKLPKLMQKQDMVFNMLNTESNKIMVLIFCTKSLQFNQDHAINNCLCVIIKCFDFMYSISSWKLVYFLKRNATKTVVDSRVTENINASDLFPIVGPRGTLYKCHTTLDASEYLTRSMSKSVTINTKLGIKGRMELQEKIAELLKKNVTGTEGC
jgi:hypothetical protein